MEFSSQENSAFAWPVPPHYYFAKGTERPGSEPCLISLSNGREYAGRLVKFAIEHSRILFQPESGGASETTILFDQLKCLTLTRPVDLLREQLFFEVIAEQELLPSEKQPFTAEFTDGSSITGLTAGFVNAEAGLYVYPRDDSNKVTRCFMPRHAIKSYRIGVEKPADRERQAAGDSALDYRGKQHFQSLADYLAEHEISTREELRQAIAHQDSLPVVRLGEALEQMQLLTEGQLSAALERQKQNRAQRLGRILIEMGIINERTLNGVLAKKLGIPYVNLAKFDYDPKAIGMVNEALARKLVLMPMCILDGKLVAAFDDPLNINAIDKLGFDAQVKVQPAMAPREDIIAAIESHYKQTEQGLAWDADLLSSAKLNDDGSIDFV